MKKSLWYGSAALVLTALVVLAGCPNPAQEKVEKRYAISGTIAAEDPAADLTKTVVRLMYKRAVQGEPVHPTAEGFFEIKAAPVDLKQYQIEVSLDGHETVTTDFFNLTKSYQIKETLTLLLPPPKLVTAEMNLADIITIAFDKPVFMAEDIAGFAAESIDFSLAIHIEGAYPIDEDGADEGTLWALALDRPIYGFEMINLLFDDAKGSVKQVGADKYLGTFTGRSVKKNFSANLDVVEVTVQKSAPLVLNIIFNDMPHNVDSGRVVQAFTLTTSSAEPLVISGRIPITSSVMLLQLSRAVTKGEELKLSYDEVKGKLQVGDGTPMPSFKDRAVLLTGAW